MTKRKLSKSEAGKLGAAKVRGSAWRGNMRGQTKAQKAVQNGEGEALASIVAGWLPTKPPHLGGVPTGAGAEKFVGRTWHPIVPEEQVE